MARAKNRLTVVEIKNSGPGRLQDGGGLILIKSGADSGRWIFRYSFVGRRRDMGLGSWPGTSLADARKHRDRWAAVLAAGKDPVSERQRLMSEERAALDRSDPTLEEMASIVFEARKPSLRGGGTNGRWYSPVRLHILPKLGKRRITTIHQMDIRDALAPIWKSKPATAEKAIGRLRIIFYDAKLSGLTVDPFTVDAARHLLGTLQHNTTPIEATPWQAIPDLYDRLNGNSASHRCLRFLLLTLVRGSPARGARADEFEPGLWTVPAARMKGREGAVDPFRVPLSPAAEELAKTCMEESPNVFLFPSFRRDMHITSTALTKALNELGEPGRPHGFRTSFRTWVQDTEAASFDVAETVLAHRIGGRVERSYARSDLLDRRRVLMNRWADFVTGQSAKVVAIRGS